MKYEFVLTRTARIDELGYKNELDGLSSCGTNNLL